MNKLILKLVILGNLLIVSTFIVHNSYATRVTFRVDMRAVLVAGSVHIAGNFQSEAGFGTDWNPATSTLTDPDADGVYSLSVSVPAGFYEYKFINGSTWPGAETEIFNCSVGPTRNRVLLLSENDTILPVIRFNTCLPPPIRTDTTWWRTAVFYQVFVRSFYDGGVTQDGKGDFAGLQAKLPYIKSLGCNAIWLMPIMASPSVHGYNITNYRAINPDYGTMAEFDAFLAEAHAQGIRVIVDLVLNHTSYLNPWFRSAAQGPLSPLRNFYSFTDSIPRYANRPAVDLWAPWRSNFYYTNFKPEPDLNWQNSAVRDSLFAITRFWLAKGLDGFRLDAIKYLNEDSLLTQRPRLENIPATFSNLSQFSSLVRQQNPRAFTVGEAWQSSELIPQYVQANGIDACFEFDLASTILSSVNSGNNANLAFRIALVNQFYPYQNVATFLGNHDQDRIMTVLGNSTPKAKLAASILFSLPGIPFVYYGEEIGLPGTLSGGGSRAPMQWNGQTSTAGFSAQQPWFTIPGNLAVANVATQLADPASLFNHYKSLIALRNTELTLQRGTYLPAETNAASITASARVLNDTAIVFVGNLAATGASPSCTILQSGLRQGNYTVIIEPTNTQIATITIPASGTIQLTQQIIGPRSAYQATYFKLIPATVTSIKALNLSAWVAYPNPGSGTIQLSKKNTNNAMDILPEKSAEEYHQYSQQKLVIYNSLTQPVFKANFSGEIFNLSNLQLPSGIYSIRISSQKETSILKLSIE
jgi:alpha-amylase